MDKKILLLEDDKALSLGIVYLLNEEDYSVELAFTVSNGTQSSYD